MLAWIKAARLRTLPLSLSGIVLGSFLAKWKLNSMGEDWNKEIFLLTILTTLLYQILSNFANDYGDFVKGTDGKNRVGPIRALQSGKISAKKMRNAIILLCCLSFVVTLVLLYVTFYPNYLREFYFFTVLGVACIVAAIGYTIGKKPYGYLGLGDIFVFIFFGPISVSGSYFLFTKEFVPSILLPSSAIGMMCVAVLNLNNMRDIESDGKTGKHTLALRMGFRKAMLYQMVLMQLPLMLMLTFMLINNIRDYYAYIFMILLFPMVSMRRKIMAVKKPKELDPFLMQVAIMCFVMSILVAFGINHSINLPF